MYNDHQHQATDIHLKKDVWDGLSVKGAFYMLVHDSDSTQLEQILFSIQSLEDRLIPAFASNRTYPWIFLTSQRFVPDYKKAIRNATRNPDHLYFGQIDLEAWTFPPWIDTSRAESAMQYSIDLNIQNAHSLHDRKQKRYQAGLFYHHSLFNDVDYVWRVEPGSSYSCDLFQQEQDPFQVMQSENKKIGFTITTKEDPKTSYNLWRATLYFMEQNPEWIKPKELTIMNWLITHDQYNFCHMWTGFEIISLDFLRSKPYKAFFHYIDIVGGFFYERWNDATIRTLAAAMFLDKSDVHFFNNIGFHYLWGNYCPLDNKLLENCSCHYKQNNLFEESSCTLELLREINPQTINDIIQFGISKWEYKS
ncbi:nucleotide-diphospho-sugar transferase [Cokeromyces recurvatus]|uniref:nucleotide-diphospho-sugar transferase n=1 Tax=Cokeromyces recurvatus TaxID=90255 RepID=UPI00221EC112|nr:nucleotide-diphospho-sugar transferase [Cokeromyces recurvatus]KAI7904913.1 nucleotide-diphospho-sugar transferase [Cokeromyces recurvatus]